MYLIKKHLELVQIIVNNDFEYNFYVSANELYEQDVGG